MVRSLPAGTQTSKAAVRPRHPELAAGAVELNFASSSAYTSVVMRNDTAGSPAELKLQGLMFSDVPLDECVSVNQAVRFNGLNNVELTRRRLYLGLQVQFTLFCFTG